jgi:nitroimidazol reductase NimA-like FMN-containing flavoprotein (pyridoxamine 5'-phosphate oxidase superfamily)
MENERTSPPAGEPLRKTPRTTVQRLPERGHYDRETANAILDEALICHVGFAPEGQPFVIPTIHARSVVVLAQAREVTDAEEKVAALRAIVEHVAAGRWDEVRWPTELELKATTVLAVPIDEASTKIRSGPPKDDEEDYARDTWAGVIPLRVVPGEPIADPLLRDGILPSDVVSAYRRPVTS